MDARGVVIIRWCTYRIHAHADHVYKDMHFARARGFGAEQHRFYWNPLAQDRPDSFIQKHL